eukprot:4039636-Pyramimonas_sp.AAC.1
MSRSGGGASYSSVRAQVPSFGADLDGHICRLDLLLNLLCIACLCALDRGRGDLFSASRNANTDVVEPCPRDRS